MNEPAISHLAIESTHNTLGSAVVGKHGFGWGGD